ncbi:MAG: hypothetical protein Q9M30_04475 [Mariprofundaceae bacterium]|nr:hypothetical protein [Mariprofundaceae bacterium]
MKLFRRKQCLRLSLAAWVLLLLMLGATGGGVIINLHGFLAPNHALGEEMLVIEGWLSDAALLEAKKIANEGGYRFVVTTGGPLAQGGFLSAYQTYAELSFASLQKIGLSKPVFPVPAPKVLKDRTYHSALALKDWLDEVHPEVRRFDLLTDGPHARRSRLLFSMAFGPEFEIGIISLPPGSYDPSRWWLSSAGVRTLIGETIAWLYARFVFSAEGSKPV